MTWKYVCSATDVPKNTLKQFDADGIMLVVANYGGRFRAFPPVCPHMEEPLEESGIIANCVLTCSKHLWSWDLGTLSMLGETEKPLKTYDVKEEEGKLFALIDKELVYEFENSDGDDDDFFK
ncbi:Rieske 2Fe-2S domain-containing protein [Methylocella silvestris]|uniref:(2Fe-2S)-binding protein n=1 Tax=Methylocella silvestris TaxID=199596 RepID=A0A2J7TDS3_METSI|nr:Rieske 2Fe-2S domain-containing protein [Methylocella silvestris]PNG24927.1 (2Fe-2S)-binding protein [Methylocella silvestris]